MTAAVPRELLKLAVTGRELGWRIRDARKGWLRWYAPDGVTIVSTKARFEDRRQLANAVTELARAGLKVQERPRKPADAPSYSYNGRIPTMAIEEVAPALTTASTVAAKIVTCRYRLVTGCTGSWSSDPGRMAHEKVSHADLLVTLRVCPECGMDCKDEITRARHLSDQHGIRARCPRRQELDALQAQSILKARKEDVPGGTPSPAARVPVPDDAPAVRWQPPAPPVPPATPAAVSAPSNGTGVFEPDGHPDLGPSPNGHSPELDLSAAQDMFIAMAAEVEELRAWKAAHEGDAVLVAEIGALYARRAAQD